MSGQRSQAMHKSLPTAIGRSSPTILSHELAKDTDLLFEKFKDTSNDLHEDKSSNKRCE